MTFAEFVRREREARGWTCNKMDKVAGLSRAQTSRYESGERLPTLEQARRVCAALGVSMAVFDRIEDT